MSYDRQTRIKYIRDNIEALADDPLMTAVICERIASNKAGRVHKNAAYFDYLCEIYKKVEVKTTSVEQQCRGLRIQSFQKKRNGFDHLHIIDALNNREFIVPHNSWFDFVGRSGDFRWAANYENDTVRRDETLFLLQYEV
jgi:hypothetical protein